MPGAKKKRRNDHAAAQARILSAAARLYAEHGLGVPRGRIARAARVSEPDLRRFAPTNKALHQRVFAHAFAGRWKPEWERLLADRTQPLEARLIRFYSEYRGNIDRAGARLWTHAGLAGRQSSGNFSATLAARILDPVARELRHDAGLASAADARVSGEEQELVQMLHGAIAFPHTRGHVFGMQVRGTLPELVAMMVRVWIPGALAEVRRLHASDGSRR
jgi:AcrR family transcriptional regulator